MAIICTKINEIRPNIMDLLQRQRITKKLLLRNTTYSRNFCVGC